MDASIAQADRKILARVHRWNAMEHQRRRRRRLAAQQRRDVQPRSQAGAPARLRGHIYAHDIGRCRNKRPPGHLDGKVHPAQRQHQRQRRLHWQIHGKTVET